MQRFWALEQVSVVLASCQPFFRRTCLVMTARILLKPCSAYLFAIGAHGLRHLFGDLIRIRDIPYHGLRPIIIKIPTPTHFCASTSMQVTVFSLLHGLSLTCTFIL